MKSFSRAPLNRQKADPFPRKDPKYPTKVAVVDDDENDRWQMTREVDQSPDLENVGSYSSGLEALKNIPSSASDVVLMDVRMPGISGIEVTKRLKDVRPGLFIFLISGFDDPKTAAQARQAGADAYLTKPFSPGRFFEALADCLQRRTLTADESSNVRNALYRIVIGLEENFHDREDLFQEARVHFWLTARQYPDRPLGWYLKSVRFHLHHFRVSGRSVDSPKRRGARSAFSENWDGREQWRDILEFDEGIMSSVNARDVFSLLRDQVKPCDRKILGALAEGFGVRDIEARLKMPHQNVIRSRKRIAALAIKLGVVPPLAASVLLSPGV